jgi:hypothetical protein
MKLVVLVTILFTFFGHMSLAQGLSLQQSDSSVDWIEFETPFVKVIFPEGRKKDAQKIAGLIDSYSGVVGEDFKITKPQQFPLVLRPGLAVPNGFVTLGPRRSEWFANETFSPFIGGLNFYQALAIHEYRHIIQFDYNYRSFNKWGYYFFGEFGSSVLLATGLPSWFFEGDAVLAETFYTDAGRGRSPRFLARLKALVLTDQVPSYDEFIGGSYKTFLPNHYTYGFALVTRARRVYGEDFWAKVVDDVATFALSPYRIYSAIERASGVTFKTFYDDTFKELKQLWQAQGDELQRTTETYERQLFPFFDEGNHYLLKKELNSFWGIYKEKNDLALVELPIRPDLSKVDLKNGRVAYTQFLPDTRFQFKGYSDLFLYDLNKAEQFQLTTNERVYHPSFSPDGKTIAATLKDKEGNWSVVFYDLTGKRLGKVSFSDITPMEVTWKSNDEIYILGQDDLGYKSLDLFSRTNKKKRNIFNGTRNNIFSLRFSSGFLSFEADWKGRVEAFTLQEKSGKEKFSINKCSSSVIASYTPVVAGDRVFFTSEKDQGQRLNSRSLSSCRSVSSQDLLGVNRLSGSSPSDSFVPKNEKLFSPKVISSDTSEVKDSGQFFSGLSPHSWSFLGGNGYQVSLTGNNLLGSFGYNIATGFSSSESRPFSNLSLSYAGYFPLLQANASYRERNTETQTGGPKEQWNEFQTTGSVTLPFVWVNDFYSHSLQFTVFGGIINIGQRSGVNVYEVNNERLNLTGGVFSWQFQKAKTFQQIIPSYGMHLLASYRKADSKRRSTFGTEQFYGALKLFLPAFSVNDGFKFQIRGEKQTSGLFNYRHTAYDDEANQYVFSRGFNYGYVDQYTKASLDYVVPLLNPNWNLLNFHYLRRVYASVFFDHTDIEILGLEGELQSFGSEVVFETNIFRRLPLNWGIRYSSKINSDQVFDFFLGSQIDF